MQNPQALRLTAALILFVIAAAPLAALEPATASDVIIPDGTEIRLRFQRGMTSLETTAGERVLFEVTHDVIVDGVTVIAAGAEAHGTVVEARKRKSFGRRGRIDLAIERVQTVGGEMVPLRFAKSLRGREKYGTAGVITLLFGPFGALVKGKDITIPEGTELVFYLEGERRVRLPAPAASGAAV